MIELNQNTNSSARILLKLFCRLNVLISLNVRLNLSNIEMVQFVLYIQPCVL